MNDIHKEHYNYELYFYLVYAYIAIRGKITFEHAVRTVSDATA